MRKQKHKQVSFTEKTMLDFRLPPQPTCIASFGALFGGLRDILLASPVSVPYVQYAGNDMLDLSRDMWKIYQDGQQAHTTLIQQYPELVR
jgi:hypothetical protein